MKYVDVIFAGDAPVELIKKTIRRGKVKRECDGCGMVIPAGINRMIITGKYKDEIGTRYYCPDCYQGVLP